MDILSIITLTALAIAFAMVVITARLLRDERRRSEARVTALAEAAAQSDAFDVYAESVRRRADAEPVASPAPRRAQPWSVEPAKPRPIPLTPPRVTMSNDLDLYPSDTREPAVSLGSTMFGTTTREDSRGGRLVPVVAIGAFIVAAGVGLVMWSSSRGVSVAPVGEVRVSAQPISTVPPLELVALRHRRDGERLAISGIVKNPSDARPIKNVSAVVFLFDSNGSFLASGRAPIDFTTLTPGDESPFVVVVTEPGAVARYRVSFRSDDHVVPHVDRREPGNSTSTGPAVSRTSAGGAPPKLVE
jgi:hypothetical protein